MCVINSYTYLNQDDFILGADYTDYTVGLPVHSLKTRVIRVIRA